CTYRLSQALQIDFLMKIPQYFIYVALVVWIFVLTGMIRRGLFDLRSLDEMENGVAVGELTVGDNKKRSGACICPLPFCCDVCYAGHSSVAACMLMEDSATSVSFSSAAFSSESVCSSNFAAVLSPRVCANVRSVP